MRVIFESPSVKRSMTGAAWWAVLVLAGAGVCVVIMVIGAVKGDGLLVENAAVALVMLAMFAGPAWASYALGRRSGIAPEIVELRREIEQQRQDMQRVVAGLGEVSESVERIEQRVGASPVRRLQPREDRRGS